MEQSKLVPQTKPTNKPRAVLAAVLLISVVVLFLLYGAPWARDAIRALTYTPPESVSKVADDLDLTPYSNFLFRASQPKLLGRDTFSDKCRQYEPTVSILGCYFHNDIYVFDVSSDELTGAKTTTMAHELLHAVYQRLSRADKARLGPLLEAAYNNVKDSDLESRMEFYAEHQPGEKYNELHSILGTEFANLPDELEEHYSKYFNNRSKIVSASQAYNKVFANLESQAEEIQNWLEQNKATIENQIQDYQSATDDYQARQMQLKSSASSIDRTNQSAVDQYNFQVSQLNNQRDELRSKAAEINKSIDNYNQKADRLNAISDKSKGLVESMDSRPLPAV